MRRALVLAAFACVPAAPPLWAQLQGSVVSGRVLGPDGTPAPRAEIVLRDTLGQDIRRVTADDLGRFRLRGVPPGVYHLGAEAAALRSPSQRVAIQDGLPVEVELRLQPRLRESLSVSSEAGVGGGSSTTLAGEAVRRATSPLPSGGLRAAVSETPGWTSEDNGLVHYRGADDGLLFVLDGIPVYERLDAQFGGGLEMLALGSVRVLSGYVPPEFGLRSGGVVEVRSQAGSLDSWSGLLEAGVGRFAGRALSGLVQGPIGRSGSAMLSVGGERSRRFLDPVSLDNLHNHGSSGGGEAELIWAPGKHAVTLRGGHRLSGFDVPHVAEQERAGHDQRQSHEHSFATLHWQRSWSSAAVSQLALFGRFTSGRLRGSPADTPLFAESDRVQDRLGVLAAVTSVRGKHRWKAGLEASRIRLDEAFRFFVTDAEAGVEAGLSEEARGHGPRDPFDFKGGARRPIVSLYAQDSWRPRDRLTLDLGLRYDRSRLLLSETQWSPRLGLTYRLGRTALRASLNRFFQPPQTEYLLLASSRAARRLSPFATEPGEGGAEVRAERQTALELGGELWLRGALRIDVAAWRRRIRNQADPNVFFGTTILFPNSVARGRADGFDVRVELPRRKGVSGFVTYTLAKVEQFGPIDGGLFLEDDFIEIGPGTSFTPDHDQRHALSAQVAFEDARRGLFVALDARYRSGTPVEASDEELSEIAGRPGAELVDFERGRVRPYTVLDLQAGLRLLRRQRFELSARGSLLNLTGARYAFNFGNPFSGTHFGAPRCGRVELRLALR